MQQATLESIEKKYQATVSRINETAYLTLQQDLLMALDGDSARRLGAAVEAKRQQALAEAMETYRADINSWGRPT